MREDGRIRAQNAGKPGLAGPQMYPMVPTAIIARLILEYVPDLTQGQLGFLSGLGERRIYEIVTGKTVNVRFDTADRIISLGLGAPELWWDVPELRAIYEAA